MFPVFLPYLKFIPFLKQGNVPVVEGSKLKNESDQSPHSASVLKKANKQTKTLLLEFFPGYILWDCDVVVRNHCTAEGDWMPGFPDPGARPCRVDFSL